jgi:archaellum biogenesis ATPase FlaH
MRRVADFLADLDLPAATGADVPAEWNADFLHDLGADLPAGHLHLWAGPRGVGKTAFLLSLLGGAAMRGRRVLYATYHLSAQTLARRLLAMVAGVDPRALAVGRLAPAEAEAAAAARETLAGREMWVLEARGFSATSLEDRLVRMPFRADVMGVDYLQAVIRPPGQDLGGLVRTLSGLASRRHVTVVGALEANEEPREVGRLADRAGWIVPAEPPGSRRAEIIENRYGPRASVRVYVDEATGILRRLAAAGAPAPT